MTLANFGSRQWSAAVAAVVVAAAAAAANLLVEVEVDGNSESESGWPGEPVKKAKVADSRCPRERKKERALRSILLPFFYH